MNSIFKFIKNLFSIVFGSLNYNPPQWLAKGLGLLGKSWIGQKLDQVLLWKRNSPKRFQQILWSSIASVLLIGGATFGIIRYLDSLPKPEYVEVQVIAPQPTSPETQDPDKLQIVFSKSAAQVKDLNKAIAEGITIKPALLGTWRWESDRVLFFKPEGHGKSDWSVGTKYKVTFEKELFPSHVLLEEMSNTFETQPLKIHAIKNEFYIDPQDPKIKKVLANFKFNYPVNTEDFKKRVSLEQKSDGAIATSKNIAYQISFNKWLTEAYVQSEPLVVPKESEMVVVKVDKGAQAQSGGPASTDYENINVRIPGLFEAFKISGIELSYARNEKYEPEQIIVVRTTVEASTEKVAEKLRILLLPPNKPSEGLRSEIKNYPWQSVSEVTTEIRKKSSEVKFQIIPSENTWSSIHTFKINVEPQHSLLVSIDKGLKGLGDYELKDPHDVTVRVGDYPQEISIMSQGAILSLSGDLKIPLLARNVSEVEFKLDRVIPEQVNHLLSQLGSQIQKPYLPSGFEYETTEKFESTQKLTIQSAAATQYFSFDVQPFLSKSASQRGIFLITARVRNPDKSYGPSDKRLIMVTDLGLLVKETVSKNNEVYVQNFRSGLPVDGATVEVVGRNGMATLKATTDSQGHVSFPDLKEFKAEKYPVAFSVRKGSDQAYLPYKNYDQYLKYSRFDVGGLFENNNSDQLMSMIFSDRGIYRPSEGVHLGLIVRSKTGQSKFNQLPIQWSVTDPRGHEILNETLKVNSSDLKALEFKTEETSPTGMYDVRVFLVKKEKQFELIGNLSVKVEEFMPDRMKISTGLAQQKVSGWIRPQVLKASVNLKNMFGTAAESRRVKGSLTLTPMTTYFKTYKDYLFSNLNKPEEQVYTESLDEMKSNDKGEAEFELNLTKYAAQLFQLRFDAEGFESEGGRSVHASSTVLVSPLNYIVGAKPDGDLLYLKKGSDRYLDLIAIDSDLKKVGSKDLEVQLVERKYVSVLTQQNDGSFKYQSVLKETPLESKPIQISASGLKFKLETSKPGDFNLLFKLKGQTQILKVAYSVMGQTNLTRSLEKNAELQLSLNKSDFKAGEEIELQIKAPYHGSGLISIERDGVFTTKWFKTKDSTTTERIRIPAGVEGNAYVIVTFLRAIDSNEIYSSPLSYAVAPFSISLDERRTKIDLDVPEKIKPGQTLKVKFSASKKTDIIIYGVDEGILQVAKYKLPDPLGFFFQKRALQVQTYQMLDLLLPEFSIIKANQAAGGDEGAGALGKNLNPFKTKRAKPVVFWSGVIKADSKNSTYTYEVPDYFNGNIKVMAVAASELGLGSQENQTLVRGDFIISPTVPVFVAPQDEFVVGLNVANQLEGSGASAQVSLDVQANDKLEVIEGQKQTLKIAEGHELGAQVKIKTKQKLGDGLLTFKASIGKATSVAKTEVSVRPSSPFANSLQIGLLEKLPLNLKNKRVVFDEYAKAEMIVSPMPLVIGTGLLDYLDSYPYGCTEQIVSKAMPALVLRTQSEFIPHPEKAKEAFKNALQVLRTRQVSNGGFALYNPNFESDNPMASLYAIHYLIEARDRQLAVPTDMLTRAQSYLQSENQNHQATDITSFRHWAYSLYLLGRLGVVNGSSLTELRRKLDNTLKNQWESDTTAMYLAAIYKLYKQDELGDKLIKSFELGSEKTTDFAEYLDPITRDSLLIYMTAKYYPQRLKNLVDSKKLNSVLIPLSHGDYNSHSAAYLLLALDAMTGVESSQKALGTLQAEVKLAQQVEKAKPSDEWTAVATTKKSPALWKLPINHSEVQVKGENSGTLFYAYNVAGFDRAPQAQATSQGLEISHEYQDKDGHKVTQVKVGDEVFVSLTARSTDNKSHPHVALVDLLPGGFELVIAKERDNLETSATEGEPQSVDTPNENYPADGYEPGDDNENAPPPADSEVEDGAQVQRPTNPTATFKFHKPGVWSAQWLRIFSQVANAQTANQSQRTRLSPMVTDFVDQREDRVVIYATVTSSLTEYTYRIKAINQGRYGVPPAFAEGMYDRSLQYLGAGSQIEVLAP